MGGWFAGNPVERGWLGADHIISELQDLGVGDTIPFIPDMGPRVKEIESPSWIVSAGE